MKKDTMIVLAFMKKKIASKISVKVNLGKGKASTSENVSIK